MSPPSLLVPCPVSSTLQSMSSVSRTPVCSPSFPQFRGSSVLGPETSGSLRVALLSTLSPPPSRHPKAWSRWLWGGALLDPAGPGGVYLFETLVWSRSWPLGASPRPSLCQTVLSLQTRLGPGGWGVCSSAKYVRKAATVRHFVPKHVAVNTMSFWWLPNR